MLVSDWLNDSRLPQMRLNAKTCINLFRWYRSN